MTTRPAAAAGLPSYNELKRALLRVGLLSCSEQGFNIARGALAGLRDALWSRLSRLVDVDEVWDTPPLLRADWAVRGVWQAPPEAQWLSEAAAGQLLTPRPLLHLVNRLRWHPQERGSWLLRGWAFREEQDTLPLYRQRCFTQFEYVFLGTAPAAAAAAQDARDALGKLVTECCSSASWPVEQLVVPAGAERTELQLAGVAPVGLYSCRSLEQAVREAYGQQACAIQTVSIGLERLCLALLAACGADPAGWPQQLR